MIHMFTLEHDGCLNDNNLSSVKMRLTDTFGTLNVFCPPDFSHSTSKSTNYCLHKCNSALQRPFLRSIAGNGVCLYRRIIIEISSSDGRAAAELWFLINLHCHISGAHVSLTTIYKRQITFLSFDTIGPFFTHLATSLQEQSVHVMWLCSQNVV